MTVKRSSIAWIPNALTSVRIVCSLLLLALTSGSRQFFLVYTLCGVTDVLDGTVARATHTTSELGSRLDSAADLIFYSVTIGKLFPVLWAALWRGTWFFAVGVVLLRLAAYGVAAVKFHRFSAMHTYLNKLTGAAVFSIAYLIAVWNPTAVCLCVCAIGGLASLEELLIHCSSDAYCPTRKTILRPR